LRDTSGSFAKRLIFHPFDYPLQISDISIANLHFPRQKSLQQQASHIYRAPLPHGTSNRKAAQKSTNVPVGGPLNCTSIIARWG
jgi:hypothetical protein